MSPLEAFLSALANLDLDVDTLARFFTGLFISLNALAPDDRETDLPAGYEPQPDFD